MGLGARLTLLIRMGFSNVRSHGVKSLIVGAILVFGSFLVVVGTSLVDGVELAMERSITQSVAGQMQVYSADGKDELALFGGGFMGADDIGRIDKFENLKSALQDVEGIKAIVPMGMDMATITAPGELEASLVALREAVNTKTELKARIELTRQILAQMLEEAKNQEVLRDEVDAPQQERLQRALSAEFWQEFAADPVAGLEYLDTKVAPLAEEGKLRYFRYLGTDLDAYFANFDRVEIVMGDRIPSHTRGLMFNKRFYEWAFKNRIARQLDQIDELRRDEKRRLGDDAELDAKVRRLSKQYQRITYQLDSKEVASLTTKLQALLNDKQDDLPALLTSFLTVTESNFDERYKFFYDEVVPMLELYSVTPGDVVTVRGYTRTGFLKALNLKVYGVFAYKGLEKSRLASGHSLMDILSFRELYGLMTEAKKAELSDIREEVGLEQVTAADAEAAFFGSDDTVESDQGIGDFDEFAAVQLDDRAEVAANFKQEEVDRGLLLNAAIVTKAGFSADRVQQAVEAAFKKSDMNVTVKDWRSAAGLVGQFILVIKGVLYIAIVIIFAVAVVIINNAMVMATMERVKEIGTLRAIGAQRSWVLGMFLVETLVLATFALVIGSAIGAGLISYWGSAGLAAPSKQLLFLFGGPRLYPVLEPIHFVIAIVLVSLVSLISTLYPAWLAAKVEPVVAMRSDDS